MMRKLLLSLLLLAFASTAQAQNYNATAGSGLVFGSKLVTAVNYPQFVMCDPTTPSQCVGVNASGQVTVLGTGTFAVQAAQTGNWTSRIVGNIGGVLDAIGQNVAAPANWLQAGCQFQTTPTTITATNGSPCQMDNAGNILVNIKAGTVTTTPPANASTNLTQVNSVALGSPSSYGTSPGAVNVPGVNAFVTNANANGQTTMANSSPVVIASNQTSFPVTIAAGSAAIGSVFGPTAVGSANANPPVVIGGTATGAAGANVQGVSIVATSTAPVTATNTALVVDLRPDSPGIIALGQTTKSASVPVAIASDQLGANTAANSLPVTIGPALLGSYCMGASTGTMAAGLAGGSPIYSFRYGGANLAIVRKVSLEADDVTTAFVAGTAKFDLIAARSFTASDTGGTAATLTGNNGKLRTSFATTAISDLRISSTATLTAGTRTLDAQPLASISFAISTNIDAVLLPTTDIIRQNVGESPVVLATNEGFVIQATVPGTGTWFTSIRTCWDEVSAF